MTGKYQPSSKPRPPRRLKVGVALVAAILVIVVAIGATRLLPSGDGELAGADGGDPTEVQNDGDGDSEADDSTSESARTYVEADVGFPGTLNPVLAESRSEEAISALLYRGLTTIDTRGDPQPDLADDWSTSEDGLTYTVELDPDATWHDGEPVTVDDVLFTISLVQEADFPGDQSLSRFWRAITVRQEGEHRITFELLEPYSGFPHYLTLPILPKHEFGGILPGDMEETDLAWGEVGSGPYTLDEVDQSSGEVRLAARDTGDDGPDVETIVFRFYDTYDEALEAFRTDEADGLSYVPQNALDDGSLSSDARVYASSMSGYTGLFFNVRHPQLRDVETRRAIEYAIDRNEIVETVLGGQAVAGSGPIPMMLSAHQPGEHAGYDPDRARELLEEAGWQSGDDGVLHRDGERFMIPLLVNGDDDQRMAVASTIEQQLWEVGVAVDIQARTSEEVQHALDSRQYGAALYGWHTENGDPDCYQMWHSSQAEEGMNFTGFADSEADEHLVSARHARTVEERNQHYAEFQRIFAQQVPAVVVFYPRYHFAVSARIDGAEPRPLVNPGDHVRQIPEWSFANTASDESTSQ